MSVDGGALGELSREERIALCREVMENLSGLIEGEAPAELCRRVEECLEGCQPYRAYRDTLEATIRLAREAGERRGFRDEDERRAFEECVDSVRAALLEADGREKLPG